MKYIQDNQTFHICLFKSVVHVGAVAVFFLHLHGSFGDDIPPYISKHLRNLSPSEAVYEASHMFILQEASCLACTLSVLNSGQ